jgi:NADPH2:quinone reductase
MKAVLCKQWGPPETLTIEEVESLAVGAGQVKVAVHTCGINFGDTLMILGRYQVKPPFPFTPGFEVAGEITAVGEGVTQYKPGDRVIAFTDYGGYAEEVVTRATSCLPIPDKMPFVDAAAFMVTYGTSHLALDHRAHLQAGEVLLVHGAAGGVGLTAVEIGKQMGATVIATASTPAKLAIAQQYGADHLINYREENFRDRVKEITGGAGADVIYDPVGGDVFDQSLRCINWEGRLLFIGFARGRIPQAPANLTLVKNCSIVGVYWGAYALKQPITLLQSMQTLLGWYSRGQLKPHISATYPLEQVAEAMNMLTNRQSTGKVVLITR